MNVTANILGFELACQTESQLICLNDLTNGFNATRLSQGKSAMQLSAVLTSEGLRAYKEEAAKAWGIPEEDLVKQVKTGRAKNQSRQYGHLSICLYLAEIASPAFHAAMHKEFIDGKLLQFREQGGTEFRKLNAAIDNFLPGREGKTSNQGLYINAAKMLRAKITAAETDNVWSTASAAQQQLRTEMEQALTNMLRLGLVRDWDHLKELIEKV